MQDGENIEGGEHFEVSGGYAVYALILLSLCFVFDFVDRLVISAVLPLIKADLNLSDAELGSLSTILTLMVGIFVIPTSVLIDRWRRGKMVALMVLFWSIASGAAYFTKTFIQLFISRLFVGVGEAGYSPGGVALLSAMWPEEKRARVMGIFNTCSVLGIVIGLVVGGAIGKKYGWHAAFGIVAIPGFLLAIPLWFLKDYKTVPLKKGEEKPNYWKTYSVFFRIPSLVCAYLGLTMGVFINNSMLHWLPTLFVRMRDVDVARAANMTAPILISTIIGGVAAGFIADWWHKKNPRGKLFLNTIILICYGLFLGLGVLFVKQSWGYAILMMAGLFGSAHVTVTITVTQDVIHPGMRALSWGLSFIFMYVLGSWSTLFSGWLSDLFNLQAALVIMAVFGPLGALFYYIGSRFYPRDAEKVEKVKLESA